jgi:hypothetical protein|tara:strand:+ start:207 stop:371 length:165 start_codon:yes stop_codon:yes gene_type:complete
MTTYKGKANPNATNSELDAKIIITHKRPDLGEDNVKYDDEDDSCMQTFIPGFHD